MNNTKQYALIFAALYGVMPAAFAQTQTADADNMEEVVVYGNAIFRNRETTPEPVLIYDLEYFQRFEPISVGDMLKRVPGVAFNSDIGEYDAPQLRGLETQYTQVLINGRRIPGSGNDRSVFVDRIPAELIEKIEIIRSPSADMESAGIGGTLNIILKEGAALTGVEARLGGIYYTEEDSAFRGAGSLSYGGQSGNATYFLSANFQERYAPKLKTERVFDATGTELDEFTIERDTRDSDDTSLAGRVDFDLGEGRNVGFEGSYLQTKRTEDEFVDVFDGDLEFDKNEFQHEDIKQNTWFIASDYTHPFSDTLAFEGAVSFSQFEDEIDNVSGEAEDGVELPEEFEDIDTTDEEVKVDVALKWDVNSAHTLKFGVDFTAKDRDTAERVQELDDGELSDETIGSGVFQIEETGIDVFFNDDWQISNTLSLSFGARGEFTDRDLTGSDGTASESDFEFNPSAHFTWRPTDHSQYRLSLARTVREPRFDELVPFTNDDSPSDDQVTIGNPQLDSETAIGVDVGYEYRFAGQDGIVGINFFYRDIQDKIELAEIGDDLFTPSNIGDGDLLGLEFDMSFPLTFANLPDVGVFANATFLDSEITDPVTGQDRDFNFMPEYIFNLGFNHTIQPWGLSYGLSYQQQGKSMEFQADEVVELEYDGNLELFVEKTFGKNYTLRFTGNNLLDAKKDEFFTKFDSLSDRQAGIVDEIEYESEETGPVFLLTLRGRF